MIKLIRVTTIPLSLDVLLKGQLEFLKGYFEIIAISGDGNHLEKVKYREGVKIKAIDMSRGISLYQDIKSLVELYCYYKREKPQIVHSITPKAGLLSMLAAKFAGVPIRMHTFTGLVFPSKKGLFQKLLIQMDRLLCWAATSVYPEGEGVKKDLLNYNITKKPLKVLANGNINGIDCNYFNRTAINESSLKKLRSKYGIFDRDFVFIFVGRLVRDKGINELVEAFERLSENPGNNNFKLLLVGPYESDLDPLNAETIKVIEKNKNIITTGFQNDVRSFFAISNVLTFPSYREGFPNVVLQAGAMDLPCIVTDINGSNEIIEDGENGLVVPVKDSEALYNKMRLLVDDSKLCMYLKGNAREMICKRFEQKLVWNALLDEYNTLLEDKDDETSF